MIEPVFLTREQVDAIHAESLRLHGGSEGVREPGLVDSAMAAALNTFLYVNGDVFDIAAAYAFHLKAGLAEVFRRLAEK